MRFLFPTSAFLALGLTCRAPIALAGHIDSRAAQHHGNHERALARAPNNGTPEGKKELVPRQAAFSGARFSFFDTGLGACGGVNTNSDFIVAMNVPQFDGAPNHHCFETITITIRGKTTTAQIVDRCEECPYAALDMSRGLFDFFGSQSEGYLYGDWFFGTSQPAPQPAPPPPPPPPSPSPPPPPPSTTPPPPPTTTPDPPPPSSTSQAPPSSSSSSPTPSPSSSSSVIPTSASASATDGLSTNTSVASTTSSGSVATATPKSPQALVQLQQAFVQIVNLGEFAGTVSR